MSSEGIIQRRPIKNASTGVGSANDPDEDRRENESDDEDQDKQTRLSLMEEVLLLGLKDREVRKM